MGMDDPSDKHEGLWVPSVPAASHPMSPTLPWSTHDAPHQPAHGVTRLQSIPAQSLDHETAPPILQGAHSRPPALDQDQ